jgi:C_GCAxxG_C_C family probable redox protein
MRTPVGFAMSVCEYLDAFPAFLAYWVEAQHEALDDQLEDWACRYMAPWPELLAKHLQDEFNLDHAVILKALGPFPGIAARGETCGAVIGSIMDLSLIFGSDKLDDWWETSLPPAREFCRLFENEHGSTACGHLWEAKVGRKCDFTNPDDLAQYVAAGGACSVCRSCRERGAVCWWHYHEKGQGPCLTLLAPDDCAGGVVGPEKCALRSRR